MSERACIICGDKIKSVCRCMRSDTDCVNGHSYHWSPFHKEWHIGESDHSTESMSEHCCKEKKAIRKPRKGNALEIKGTVEIESDGYVHILFKDEQDFSYDGKGLLKQLDLLEHLSLRTGDEVQIIVKRKPDDWNELTNEEKITIREILKQAYEEYSHITGNRVKPHKEILKKGIYKIKKAGFLFDDNTIEKFYYALAMNLWAKGLE